MTNKWVKWEEKSERNKEQKETFKRLVVNCSSDSEEETQATEITGLNQSKVKDGYNCELENDDHLCDGKEVYLYVDFKEALHEELLKNPNINISITGFEGENPIIQIGDETYEGEYEDACGTYVMFEEDKEPEVKDEVFAKEVPTHVKYLCKTSKVLNMNRIFIKDANDQEKESRAVENIEQMTIAETVEEALEELDANIDLKLANKSTESRRNKSNVT